MKNEIIQIAKKNLATGEDITKTVEGNPILNIKFDLRVLYYLGILLFIISLFTFYKSTKKIDWGNEMSSKYGSYWNESLENNSREQNGNMWKNAGNNFKTRQNNYRIISLFLFLSSCFIIMAATMGGIKDNYFFTSFGRVLIIRLNEPVKFFKIRDIKSINFLGDNKIIIETNIGETFKIDKSLKEIIESESFTPIHKT